MQSLESEIKGMKRDAEALGKEVSDRSPREQAETLDNLREHMSDLGQVHDLKTVIQEPFCRGTKY
jgi:poly-gamma-glutamate capsule biosynthesis protein CapA/YwtB (metallophosphatase superfamily)